MATDTSSELVIALDKCLPSIVVVEVVDALMDAHGRGTFMEDTQT